MITMDDHDEWSEQNVYGAMLSRLGACVAHNLGSVIGFEYCNDQDWDRCLEYKLQIN